MQQFFLRKSGLSESLFLFFCAWPAHVAIATTTTLGELMEPASEQRPTQELPTGQIWKQPQSSLGQLRLCGRRFQFLCGVYGVNATRVQRYHFVQQFWGGICSIMGQEKMPIVKYPRTVEPLWYEWDRKAQKCGLRHTIYAVNGDRYVGEWLDNLKHGKGTQIWKKTGAIYSGDWKFGKRDGYGTYSLPDPVTKDYKKVYAGWWRNGQTWGYGIKFYSNLEYYEGEWQAGKRNGWGRMYYKDGSIYEGQWAEDKAGGEGMFRLKNENRYEGCWKDGKKHGPGRFIYLDTGQIYEGYWVADTPKCGTMIDFGRDEAPEPTQYPIPKIELVDPMGVIEDAIQVLEKAEELSSQSQKER